MSLAGKSVLLLEGDPIVSTDLAMMLEDRGARVIGPFRTVAQGLSALDRGLPGAALLGIELLDGRSFPVVARLRSNSVPVLLYSRKGSEGYDAARAGDVPLLSKAHPGSVAVDRLATLVAG